MGGLGNNSENNGFLELDDPDQELFLINSAYSLQTGSGGHISAAIQVDDHYWCNTAIGVQIVNSEEDGDQAFVGIKVIGEDGNIRAYWGDENVSYTEDIKSAVGADKKITVQLSIDTLNSVTAMWDYGSDGTFELVKTNLSQLNFITDSDYSGALGMWSAGANYDPYDENANLVIGDFELLHAIDDWATSLLGDFALLNLIDYWAAGSYC